MPRCGGKPKFYSFSGKLEVQIGMKITNRGDHFVIWRPAKSTS